MDYSALIKKLKTRRNIVLIIGCIVLCCITLQFIRFYMLFKGLHIKDIVSYEMLFPLFAISFWLVAFFMGVAKAAVMLPIQNSLTKECDPEKYMVLSAEFAKTSKLDLAYATSLIFMGDFRKAVYHAERLTFNKRYAATGAFNKARCEFFMGEFGAMRKTIQQYDYVATNIKMNEKNRVATEKIKKVLELMIALSENDKEKIELYRHEISVWNEGKAIECFIYYMKGLAAYKLEDREECLYRFMYVKENGPKTFFGRSAEEHLSKLN